MWMLVNEYPLIELAKSISAEQVYLGWRKVLNYSDYTLSDVQEGKRINVGRVDDCCLSRSYCAVISNNSCWVFGLYDSFKRLIDLNVIILQVCMMALGRVALRTPHEVIIYNFIQAEIVYRAEIRSKLLSAGFDHLLVLDSDDKVFAWGDGSRGQQGDGSLGESRELLPVDDLGEVIIKEIAAGGWHCAALSDRGDIYQWGWNQDGQCRSLLKKHSSNIVTKPEYQMFEKSIIQIACGSKHTSVLNCDGNLTSWGSDHFGQCASFEETSSRIVEIKAAFWTTAVKYETVRTRKWHMKELK